MNGILNIIKPSGMTSHDVVSFIRKITGIRRIGHSGTLDPLAVGVLPVFIGNATKAIDYLEDNYKTYRAEISFGTITDTGDKEGTVIQKVNWKESFTSAEYKRVLINALESFKGKSMQLPHMYSAVKIQGKKLYELARQGKEVTRKPREIDIKNIKLIDSSFNDSTALIDVTCSKGTYIRVLCEDIGKKLEFGAHMSYLIRTNSCGFDIKDAVTLEKIEQLSEENKLNTIIISIEQIFVNKYKLVITNIKEYDRLLNGAVIYNKDTKLIEKDYFSIYYNDLFIGIGQARKENEKIAVKIKKIFNKVL